MSDSPEKQTRLDELRRKFASYLAQKLTFSLFETGRHEELRARIRELIDERLLQEETPLDEETKAVLIQQILDGMPQVKNDKIQPTASHLQETALSLGDLQSMIRPYLASMLTDDLFEPDRKKDLSHEIRKLIDRKLSEDEMTVSPEQKETLYASICQTMSLEPEGMSGEPVQQPPSSVPEAPPAAPSAQHPPEGREHPDQESEEREAENTLDEENRIPELPPVPKAPDAPQPSPGPSEPIPSLPGSSKKTVEPSAKTPEPAAPPAEPLAGRTPQSKPLPKTDISSKPNPVPAPMLPLKALTHEIKRDLLFDLSTKLNPEIFSQGDELDVQTHIYNLIHEYCRKHRFTLSDRDVDQISNEILSGGALEFQL